MNKPDLTGLLLKRKIRQLSPPLRGGVAATSIKYRAASFPGADGVVIQLRQNFVVNEHHPVCAAEDAAQLFVDRAATPPRGGGEADGPIFQREQP